MSDAMMQEMDIARKLLKKHGKVTAQAIKELRNKTDMPIWKCADMLKCLWHDMELAQLLIENKRLRELEEALLTSHEEMTDYENMEYKQAYEEGFERGYARGFACAMDIAHNDMRQLREALRAILEKGEAPAHVMSDE